MKESEKSAQKQHIQKGIRFIAVCDGHDSFAGETAVALLQNQFYFCYNKGNAITKAVVI